MAIVKLQNGNVLLKDGKVSCSCCAPPACCMYPAQGLLQGLYTADDLPDSLTVLATYFNGGMYFNGEFTYEKSGSLYIQTTFPPVGSFPSAYGDLSATSFIDPEWGPDPRYVWYFGPQFQRTGEPCLIGGGFGAPAYQVNDQFADSYSWLSDDPFAGDPYTPVSSTVTRVSLCRWEGPLLPFAGGEIFCRPVLYLYRASNDVPSEYAFVWRMQWEGDQAETGGDKIGFNNTPVGEYNAEPGTWVIS